MVRRRDEERYVLHDELLSAAERHRFHALLHKKEHGEDPSWMPNQYFAALTNMRSVGVMGDFRTYDYGFQVPVPGMADGIPVSPEFQAPDLLYEPHP